MKKIEYYGRTIEFPDNFSDEQIVALLDQLDSVSQIPPKSQKIPPVNAERFSMDSKGQFYPDATGRFYIDSTGNMSQGNSKLSPEPHSVSYSKGFSELNLPLVTALADGVQVAPKKTSKNKKSTSPLSSTLGDLFGF